MSVVTPYDEFDDVLVRAHQCAGLHITYILQLMPPFFDPNGANTANVAGKRRHMLGGVVEDYIW
jgi:hypothetical protein